MQINVWILADKSKFRGVVSSVVRLLVCAIERENICGIPQKKYPKDDDNMVVTCI